ncbi:hypothetical protein MC378_15250 [Polaribacter sp. MSW13]|uniref:Uncharacterized protein n=1 Tax=Polaribacter marinus TaxID=2916838 RepID=A0A9X2AKK4_9FLAO|nr:hypothetical protein [Polaribacter marinus]MCI2230531.1 hypothetical protein [Polaribacter marinus]
MKTLQTMNANKYFITIFIFYCTFSFSQKKEDVYFILKENNSQYLITANFNQDLEYITLFRRKEYELHKKKVKEAKKNGIYEYNPDSGRDNLKIKVPKLTFEIISKNKISECEFLNLKLIDYKWILNNSWKKIAKQPYDFKDIYFLHKIKDGKYISYKVGLTIVEY